MPTIEPGAIVAIDSVAATHLSFPPPTTELIVSVEDAALKSPSNGLTTVVSGASEAGITWVGSVDEVMLATTGKAVSGAGARAALSGRMLVGSRLYEVVRPGTLRSARDTTRDTVYQGDRPWVVIGELESGDIVAVPLNDLGSGVKGHYQCEILRGDLSFGGAKDSKAELNHVWSFPAGTPKVGVVETAAHAPLRAAVQDYFPGRTR